MVSTVNILYFVLNNLRQDFRKVVIKMVKSRRNEKKLQAKIKMSKKHLKTITKKVAKPVQETPMEIDNPVVAAPKESRTSLKKGKKIAKRSMNAALHLPNTTRAEEDHEKEKKLPKVNENRLRLHQMPLFLNPKAK